MYTLTTFFSIMFLLVLTGLIFYRTHLLSALLCLEGMMLTLFISFSLWVLKFNTLIFTISPMILITFSACEASMGLSLLVSTIRSHGTDHLQNMNMLQC